MQVVTIAPPAAAADRLGSNGNRRASEFTSAGTPDSSSAAPSSWTGSTGSCGERAARPNRGYGLTVRVVRIDRKRQARDRRPPRRARVKRGPTVPVAETSCAAAGLDTVVGLPGHDRAGRADRAVLQQPGFRALAVEVPAVGVREAQGCEVMESGGEKPHAGTAHRCSATHPIALDHRRGARQTALRGCAADIRAGIGERGSRDQGQRRRGTDTDPTPF